ncbi:amidohydrolase family protein [Saccharopolyspora karakumensis]|nr:amidohydrolase family protein [Saccharopolyspora karakumensis]
MRPDAFDDDEFLLLPEVLLLPDGPVRGGAVVVSRGEFAMVGEADAVVAARPDLRAVHLDRHLLMPGFVDAHHHLTQSFGKALAFGEPSEIFRRIWVPLERQLTAESAYVAAKLAAFEALRGGFTTVAEAGTRAPVDVSSVAQGVDEAGLRCVLGAVCEDVEVAERHLTRWDSPLLHPSLAIPTPDHVPDGVLRELAQLCDESGAILQIHVNEHLASVERSLEKRGLRPLEHLDQIGALGPQILGAHATLLTPGEIRLLTETGTAISYNPVASAWKGNAVAPATAFLALGVRFGIGTDGTRGDGFRLVDAAEFAQRIASGLATGDSSCGGGWTWLQHAISGDAVGIDRIGRIETGGLADFLLVDLNVPELCPSWDLPWELVRLTNRDQITAVFVGGRLRLWHGRPVDWDGRELLERGEKLAREVVATAELHRVHPRSTEVRR